jgi:Domain of unknown function (DUF4399)
MTIVPFLRYSLVGLTFSLSVATLAQAERKVWFGNLKDGAKVTSPFKVEMKSSDLVVEAATKGVTDGHGHFHIIVNGALPDTGKPIPKDSVHIHYGAGQTEAELDLPVGEHSLALQFAKGDHIPYSPQLVQHIRIEVTAQKPKADTSKAATKATEKPASAKPAVLPKP